MTEQGFAAVFTATATSKSSPKEIYDTLTDLRTHVEWGGRKSANKGLKTNKTLELVEIDAPAGAATTGTRFSSKGASRKEFFHDQSVVTDARAGEVFAFETDARLARNRAPEWTAHFVHRYEITPDGDGARVDYTCSVRPVNYMPYWLKPMMKPMTKWNVNRIIGLHLRNLAEYSQQGARH